MRIITRARLSAVLALVGVFSLVATAQWDKTPPAQWTDKQVEKLLTDSPWARKVEAETSKLRSVPNSGTSRRAPASNTGTDAKRSQDLPRGSANSDGWNTTTNQDSVTRTYPSNAGSTTPYLARAMPMFSIKLLSAKPVREALVRSGYGQQYGEYSVKLLDTLDKDTEHIFVAVGAKEMSARRHSALLLKGTTSHFERYTFLEVKDGQRVPLKEFIPARDDIVGGIFVFPRTVNGEPFVNPESGEIRFQTMLYSLKLLARYKVKDLMFAGELAY